MSHRQNEKTWHQLSFLTRDGEVIDQNEKLQETALQTEILQKNIHSECCDILQKNENPKESSPAFQASLKTRKSVKKILPKSSFQSLDSRFSNLELMISCKKNAENSANFPTTFVIKIRQKWKTAAQVFEINLEPYDFALSLNRQDGNRYYFLDYLKISSIIKTGGRGGAVYASRSNYNFNTIKTFNYFSYAFDTTPHTNIHQTIMKELRDFIFLHFCPELDEE